MGKLSSFKKYYFPILLVAIFGSVIFAPTDVDASFHLWDINEIYSNSDGTQQFIELTTNCKWPRISNWT